MKNIQIAGIKRSTIERLLNYIVVIVMIITFVVCIICTFFGFLFKVNNSPQPEKGLRNLEYIYLGSSNQSDVLEGAKIFVSFFAIFSTLIPLSIIIIMEICKGVQVALLGFDKLMQIDKNDKFRIFT